MSKAEVEAFVTVMRIAGWTESDRGHRRVRVQDKGMRTEILFKRSCKKGTWSVMVLRLPGDYDLQPRYRTAARFERDLSRIL